MSITALIDLTTHYFMVVAFSLELQIYYNLICLVEALES